MLAADERKQTQFRIPLRSLALIDRVAKIEGRTRTDVVVEAATKYAEEALLDRTRLVWNEEALKAFASALDAPARPSAYVVAARQQKRAWE
jgi:uncharacterized protein (DUF1778 family)